jgi:hypothetical protein
LFALTLERLCIQGKSGCPQQFSVAKLNSGAEERNVHQLKMKTVSILAAFLAVVADAAPTVDELYPYTGPKVPVGDWMDPTVKGNGKGFVRLIEPPAVMPASTNPSNNVNVISVSYIPNGINIHYQTPFGLGEAPSVVWGTSASDLSNTATGKTVTY